MEERDGQTRGARLTGLIGQRPLPFGLRQCRTQARMTLDEQGHQLVVILRGDRPGPARRESPGAAEAARPRARGRSPRRLEASRSASARIRRCLSHSTVVFRRSDSRDSPRSALRATRSRNDRVSSSAVRRIATSERESANRAKAQRASATRSQRIASAEAAKTSTPRSPARMLALRAPGHGMACVMPKPDSAPAGMRARRGGPGPARRQTPDRASG